MTKEQKYEKFSKLRKQYWKQHPQKHPWKRKQKFISTPCQELKKYFLEQGINFYPEYKNKNQFQNHKYSIDIAFPNQKIAIQVNGNQHYNNDGTLKEDYQKRHDIIEKAGWKIFEIPYNKTYDIQVRQSLVKMIKESVQFTYDYTKQIEQRIKQNKQKHICPICGGQKKEVKSKCCDKCRRQLRAIQKNKNIPSKQQLLKDIQQLGSITAIGRKYNRSDNAVKRWCKKYQIPYHIKDIRKDLLYQYKGQKYLLSQLVKKFNLTINTLRERLYRGMTIQKAVQYQGPNYFQISKQQLQQDLNSGFTKSDIARKYNKTFGWVRRWCNKYGL